jgi:hypothetical protein
VKDKGFPLHQWVFFPTLRVEGKETQAGAAALLGAVRALCGINPHAHRSNAACERLRAS